jgi:hypothetical protein
MLIGRVRLFSLWTIAAIIAGALLLFTGIYRGRLSFDIPLICLGACFLIFLADILLSVHHVRKLWRKSAAAQEPRFPDSWTASSSSIADGDEHDHPHPNGRNGSQTSPNGADLRGLPVSEARLVYHDNHRIIGAGTSLTAVDFTVGLEKPLDNEKAIKGFTPSDLMAQVGFHVISQGVGESDEFARGIWSAADRNSTSASHFTYGLRNLSVGPVIATPVPKSRKHPILRVIMVKLNYYDCPSAEYILEVIDRSPIGHPERHYVCASMSSWEGELVTSLFFNAALEGHSLSMTIQPYVLAPIVPDLRAADDLATQNPLLVTCRAVAMTARQFAAAAERVNHLGRKADKPGQVDTSIAGLHSARERYAQVVTDHMDQAGDASRIIRVLEAKIVRATMNYLRDHNIDINEDERRALNHVQTYNVFGDGVINTGDNSQVNNAKGDGNNQTNTSNKN